jgi:hypothetical protein
MCILKRSELHSHGDGLPNAYWTCVYHCPGLGERCGVGSATGCPRIAPCGPQKFHPPLRAGNSESGHEKFSLLLEVSEVVIG